MNMRGTQNYDTSPVHLDYGGFALLNLCLGGFSLFLPLTCPSYMTAACSWHHLQARGN